MKPSKPGFANRCPACSEPEPIGVVAKTGATIVGDKNAKELNQARKRAIRDLLYRKDS